MEDSPLTLSKWAVAFWLEVNAKNSISSYEIHRALGITQKSAWFMLHRIRLALKQGSFDSKLGGGDVAVEADETMVGGKAANMHKHVRDRKVGRTRGGAHMTSVMGLLERHSAKKHSTVRAKVIPNRQKETLHAMVNEHVEPGSKLYTDALKNYRELAAIFQHEFIDHAETYVRGAVHTNGLENFWSLFKRCVKGTHVSIEPFHLEAYVDSEAFRFNNRQVKDGDRFLMAVGGAAGKRLTYKALIGENYSELYTASDNVADNGEIGMPN
jgi:transposase-like protein